MKVTIISGRIFPRLILAIPVLLFAAGCAGNSPAPQTEPTDTAALGINPTAAPDSVPDLPGFSGRIYQDGRVLIGGQPDQQALRLLPTRGVTAVINLRTAKEMGDTSKVAFDEAALVDSLGLAYVDIPLGGKDHPYDPAALEEFAAALDQHTGPVLLHCASGGRASHIWAAYLVRYQGWGVSEAYARGEQIGIGRSPFSRFLDIQTTVVVEEP